MRKTIKTIICLFVLAVLVWGFFQLKKLPSLSHLFTPEKLVIENSPVIVRQVRSLAQLVTVSMYDEVVADTMHTEVQKFHLPLLPAVSSLNRLVVIGKVTVHVGIDMQQLQEGDISGTNDSLHIKLPPAQVLDAIVNPSGVEVFIEEGDWSSAAVARLKTKIQYLAIADAQSRGLLAQSESKAKEVLANFFMAAGYKKVEIGFKTKPGVLE